MDHFRFPLQQVIVDNRPYTPELLPALLGVVYDASVPFTGYLRFAGKEFPLYFLFFLYGAPFAAGRYTEGGKSARYSIQELGGDLARSAGQPMTVSVCETDPLLMKGMLLFMQEEPDVKGPTTLIDCEHIVGQISESGKNAMIAMLRDNKISFFYFSEGKGKLAYYADLSFERPEGMTVDEELLLYAYQPGEKVQAFIYREMTAVMADDMNLLDKKELSRLLTVGYLENRRRGGGGRQAAPVENAVSQADNAGGAALEPAAAEMPAKEHLNVLKHPCVVLTVESGEHQGERFVVKLPCIIGRMNSALMLEDRLVSRQHAELKLVEHKLVIEDLKSKNGTMVNGKRVTRAWLAPGDLITIGRSSIRVSPV